MGLAYTKLGYHKGIDRLIYPVDIDRWKEGHKYHQKYNCQWYYDRVYEVVKTLQGSGVNVTINEFQNTLVVCYPGEPIETVTLANDATEIFLKRLLAGLYIKQEGK